MNTSWSIEETASHHVSAVRGVAALRLWFNNRLSDGIFPVGFHDGEQRYMVIAPTANEEWVSEWVITDMAHFEHVEWDTWGTLVKYGGTTYERMSQGPVDLDVAVGDLEAAGAQRLLWDKLEEQWSVANQVRDITKFWVGTGVD